MREFPILVLFVFLCFSCKNKEKTPQTNSIQKTESASSDQVVSNTQWLEGTVTSEHQANGCDYLIKIVQNKNEVLLNPINLTTEYKSNGLKILLQYKYTRVKQEGPCFTGALIFINQIKKK